MDESSDRSLPRRRPDEDENAKKTNTIRRTEKQGRAQRRVAARTHIVLVVAMNNNQNDELVNVIPNTPRKRERERRLGSHPLVVTIVGTYIPLIRET